MGSWSGDKFHGPAILVSRGKEEEEEEAIFHCGVFREGEKIEGSLSVTQLQHDSKWAGLFTQCANLLQEMVQQRSTTVILLVQQMHLSLHSFTLPCVQLLYICTDPNVHIMQVTSSHSNPEVSHRASPPEDSHWYNLGGGEEDEMSDIYRGYGVMARNARKECLVCSMEVYNYS